MRLLDPQVAAWVRGRDRQELRTTSVTIAEIRYGIARLPDGRRKQVLLTAASDIFRTFGDQVLPVDEGAAEHYAAIASSRERSGKPISGFGGLIAAVCRSRDAALATRIAPVDADCGWIPGQALRGAQMGDRHLARALWAVTALTIACSSCGGGSSTSSEPARISVTAAFRNPCLLVTQAEANAILGKAGKPTFERGFKTQNGFDANDCAIDDRSDGTTIDITVENQAFDPVAAKVTISNAAPVPELATRPSAVWHC